MENIFFTQAAKGVTEIFIAGLATDYCVKFSALDAIGLGLAVCVVLDGCRGVDLHPGDIDRALGELQDAGVRLVESSAVVGDVGT